MGLNIFEVDKDSAEYKEERSSDLVGRFRSGYQVGEGKDARPVALSEFRITTGDPEVAAEIASVLGAKEDPAKWNTTTDQNIEVFTETSALDIIVDGPGAVKATLVLWGQNAKILETDGTYLYGEDGKITDEISPMTQGKTMKELKAAHRAGRGPGPSLQAYFTIASAPHLGKFAFFSSSWTALENFGDISDELAEVEGPQLLHLKLEKVEFTNKDGENVVFTKPVLTLLGPADDTDAPFGGSVKS